MREHAAAVGRVVANEETSVLSGNLPAPDGAGAGKGA
jgi:hypothetical protein